LQVDTHRIEDDRGIDLSAGLGALPRLLRAKSWGILGNLEL